MASKQPSKAEPAASGGTGGIIQVTSDDDFMINEAAKQWGVPKAEALRRLLEAAKQPSPEQEQSPVANKTLKTIQEAQTIGLISQDPNDIINTMGKGIMIKSLGRQLNEEDTVKGKGKFQIEDIKEMMYLNLLSKMAGGGENTNQQSTIIQEMKEGIAEQRKFYEDKLKEQDDKLKDLLFDKKIKTLEDTNSQNANALTGQLAEINQRIEMLRIPPANPTPEQAKDAIGELEGLGKQVSRIKGVFTELGIIPQSAQTSTLTPGTPGSPGNEVWREKDGSINKGMYAIDKLSGALEKGLDAWQKKKPEFEMLEDTPLPEKAGHGQAQVQKGHVVIQMDMTEEEYYNLLRSKPQLTADELNWIK